MFLGATKAIESFINSLKTIILILFFGLNFSANSRQKLPITVSDFQRKVAIGGHFTVHFEVKNFNIHESGVRDTLLLPENWQILTHKKTHIDSTSTRYQYTILTSRHSASGDYSFEFQLLSGTDQLGAKRVSAYVQETSNVEIVNLTQHEYVQEGEVILSKFLVQNSGNKIEKVQLETTRGEILEKKDMYYIKPDSSVLVYVQQKIPVTDQNFWQTSADLSVHSESTKTSIISFITIPVYSSKIKKNDKYLRFPMEVGTGYLNFRFGNQLVNAHQYFINGSGFLDFDNRNHISFSVRGPSQFDFPSVGNTEEYTMSYTHKAAFTVTAGDYLQRVSNLMEFGRYGRGVKIDNKFNKIGTSVFYQKARFFPNQKDSFGGSITYNVTNKISATLNFISKNLTNPENIFTSNILGTSLNIKRENLLLETEVAVGEAQKKFSIGLYNKLFLKLGKLQINNELVFADKDFYGFYNNSWLLVNGINYTFSSKVSIGINTNVSRTNPSLDVNVFSISPYAETHMGYISYQLNQKNLLSFNFIKQEREDRQKPSKFHFEENLGNLSYSLSTDKFNLSTQSRYGYTRNLLADDSLSKNLSYSNSIQPTTRIVPWMWIGGYFEHQHTRKFTKTNEPENLVYFGGNLRVNFKQNFNLNLSYRNNYSPDQFFEQRTFLDASLNYDTKHHQVSLNGGRVFLPNMSASQQNTLFFSLKYVLKLNIPIVKNKKLGIISGQIHGINNDTSKEGVMVQLGDKQFLTDASGKFYFKDLVPDSYFLKVVNNKVGVISTTKFPMKLEVKADSTTKLDVSFIKTGGVIGKINFDYSAKAQKVMDNEKIPLILVTLYNDKETYTTQMNSHFEFSFKEMKPDTWKIKVHIPGKQPLFTIQNPEQTLQIEPDQLKEVNFKVKHTERKIYFSDRNYNISLNK